MTSQGNCKKWSIDFTHASMNPVHHQGTKIVFRLVSTTDTYKHTLTHMCGSRVLPTDVMQNPQTQTWLKASQGHKQQIVIGNEDEPDIWCPLTWTLSHRSTRPARRQ